VKDRINSLEMWCWHHLLGVSWREHRTNESVLDEMGLEKGLMKSVAGLVLQYFGHVVRGSAGELSLTILEGAVNGTRHQRAPHMSWIHNVLKWSGKTYGELKADNIKTWTRLSVEELIRMTEDRDKWPTQSRMAKEQNRTLNLQT